MIELTFLAICLGALLGRIGKGSFRPGAVGILIASIPIGVLLGHFGYMDGSVRQYYKYFGTLGSTLFIAAVAITGGRELSLARGKGRVNKILKAFFAGASVALVGAAASVVCLLLDSSLNVSATLGLLSGAMTSTPALSFACELEISGSDAMLGYGASYCLGLLSVVCFVRLARIKDLQSDVQASELERAGLSRTDALLPLSAVIFFGALAGRILHIGNTAGILVVGMLAGLAASLKRMSLPDMENIKKLGMAMFFVGNGISAGMDIRSGFFARWFLYGLFISCAAILIGFLMLRALFRFSASDSLAVLCGGMTSTPALGTLQSRKSRADVSLYFSSYAGALLALLVAVKIIFEIFKGRG